MIALVLSLLLSVSAAQTDQAGPAPPPPVGPPAALALPPAMGLQRVALPEVTEHSLPGGARLWMEPRPSAPLIALELVLTLPPAQVDHELQQALRLLPVMVDHGARGAPPGGLDAQLEPLGASVVLAKVDTGLRLRLLTPPERLEASLDLIAGALVAPEVARRDLRRAQQSAWRAHRSLLGSATGRLRRSEIEALYPPEHLLARWRPTQAWPGRSAFLLQHARLLGQGGATLVLLGPVGPVELELVAQRLGSLGPPVADPSLEPARGPSPGPAVIPLAEPGAQQARVVVAFPVPVGVSWAEAQLVADVLGGGATARLDRRLREELGLVYEATARLVREPGHARLRIETRLSGSDPAPGFTALQAELAGMDAIDPAELQRARATRLFAAARELDSLERSAARMGQLALLGLDPAAWQRELDDLASVDHDAVERAAAAMLEPCAATWVILGDPEVMDALLHMPTGCTPAVESEDRGTSSSSQE